MIPRIRMALLQVGLANSGDTARNIAGKPLLMENNEAQKNSCIPFLGRVSVVCHRRNQLQSRAQTDKVTCGCQARGHRRWTASDDPVQSYWSRTPKGHGHVSKSAFRSVSVPSLTFLRPSLSASSLRISSLSFSILEFFADICG